MRTPTEELEYACLAWFHLSTWTSFFFLVYIPLTNHNQPDWWKPRALLTTLPCIGLIQSFNFSRWMPEKHHQDLKEEARDWNGTFLWLLFCYSLPVADGWLTIHKLPPQIQLQLVHDYLAVIIPLHSSTVCSDTLSVSLFFALHLQINLVNKSATRSKLAFLWQSKLRMSCLWVSRFRPHI